jgi:hypothetical protein
MEKHPNFIANGITLSPRGNRGYEICNISKWYMAIGSYEIPHCNCNSTDETMTGNVVVSYSLHVEIFVVIDFFCYNFDHSSYSKNCASTIYFVCYMLYYCMYFNLDVSFYMFPIIF